MELEIIRVAQIGRVGDPSANRFSLYSNQGNRRGTLLRSHGLYGMQGRYKTWPRCIS